MRNLLFWRQCAFWCQCDIPATSLTTRGLCLHNLLRRAMLLRFRRDTRLRFDNLLLPWGHLIQLIVEHLDAQPWTPVVAFSGSAAAHTGQPRKNKTKNNKWPGLVNKQCEFHSFHTDLDSRRHSFHADLAREACSFHTDLTSQMHYVDAGFSLPGPSFPHRFEMQGPQAFPFFYADLDCRAHDWHAHSLHLEVTSHAHSCNHGNANKPHDCEPEAPSRPHLQGPPHPEAAASPPL
jgi:hypothetical protein